MCLLPWQDIQHSMGIVSYEKLNINKFLFSMELCITESVSQIIRRDVEAAMDDIQWRNVGALKGDVTSFTEAKGAKYARKLNVIV